MKITTVTSLIEALESFRRRYGDSALVAQPSMDAEHALVPVSKTVVFSEEENGDALEFYGLDRPTLALW